MTSETTQLKVDIDTKVHFFAKLAARYKGITLEKFVEDAIRAASTPEAVENDEPIHGVSLTPPSYPPIWREDYFWDDDPLVRLFNVAISELNGNDSKLLTSGQKTVFTTACAELARQGKKLTKRNFVEFFDSKDGE